MRALILGTAALLGVAACEPTTQQSGVGFSDYDNYREQQRVRDAALSSSVRASLPPAAISNERPQSEAEQIAAATTAALGQGTAQSEPLRNSDGSISQENDFEVVSERETIESDAERLERQRQQYQVVQPTELPDRSQAGDRPNIVQYALSTTHNVGDSLYRRRGINLENRSIRACAQYPSSDVAQEDFLASGGPERDRKALDPDGDGFACAWDPSPFRQVRY
ncbi:hypothetical protein [Pseudaestuariivita rosea]|uniref:hypothetical protein n=1 Tax=Pseudaestuariivita rosea TaxID=2763263 RepID=UPI001ABA4A95|nr:hypothetical protein [Pseudaestuariivita rosea]